MAPAAINTTTSHGPVSAAAVAPTTKYPTHRARATWTGPTRRQLAGIRPSAACTATAATDAPAPAAAPRAQPGVPPERKNAANATITINPGTMNATPPTNAPRTPRSRQAV